MLGSFMPGLMALIAGHSSGNLAQVDVGEGFAAEFDLAIGEPGRLTMMTTPPVSMGNCTRPSRSCSSMVSGLSVPAKSTVLALIWLRPAPEPTLW
jgi:hypothetical protein